MRTTKRKLKRARALSNDELIGWLYMECTNGGSTAVARMFELRRRLSEEAPAGDKSDPRGK